MKKQHTRGGKPRGGERSFARHEGERSFTRHEGERASARHEERRHEERAPERSTPPERRRHDDSEREATHETGAQIYGVAPVLEALRAGARPVERITVAEGAHEHRLRELMELAHRANIPVRRAPRAELQRISAGANHQGIIATVAAARYADAGELLDALASRIGTENPPLAVALDGVEDPRNLGAIIRTAECGGVHALFLPERRSAGLTETAAKAAAGALEYLPVARAPNLVRLIEELKERGLWIVGAAAEGETLYTDWDWTTPSVLVMGGEGAGLRRLVREHCDALLRIPLRGHISSLNVSVAAGIVLYEAVRQRTPPAPEAYTNEP